METEILHLNRSSLCCILDNVLLQNLSWEVVLVFDVDLISLFISARQIRWFGGDSHQNLSISHQI